MHHKLIMMGLSVGGGIYAVVPVRAPDPEPIFAQPKSTAVFRLAAKSRLVEGTGLGSLTLSGLGGATDTVVIVVRRAGDSRSLSCRVAVSAIDPTRSRADTDCTQRTPADAQTRALGRDALGIIVREHVAATVQNRRYDIAKVGDRMLMFAALNGPALMASTAAK